MESRKIYVLNAVPQTCAAVNIILFYFNLVRPVPVRMEVGGRNEAARRRQSIALEKQRTYSTVENHINQVKKDREGSLEFGKHDLITEEHGRETVDIDGQQRGSGDDEDTENLSCSQAEEQGGNLNTPSHEK